MDIETTLNEMRREHREGMGKIYSSLDTMGGRVGNIEVAVGRLEVKAHKPEDCPGLNRHEKDHDRSGNLLRNLSIGLGILALVGGAVAGLIKLIV